MKRVSNAGIWWDWEEKAGSPRASYQGCGKCGGTSLFQQSWHKKKFQRKADLKRKVKMLQIKYQILQAFVVEHVKSYCAMLPNGQIKNLSFQWVLKLKTKQCCKLKKAILTKLIPLSTKQPILTNHKNQPTLHSQSNRPVWLKWSEVKWKYTILVGI